MTGGERPGEAVALAAGTAVVGVAGYAFVAFAGHLFAPPEAAAVATLYMLVNIMGPGVFLAVEQEVSRRTARAAALGQSVRPALTSTAIRGAGLLGAGLLALALGTPFLVGDVLAGHGGLVLVIAVTTALTAMMSSVRGVLAGLGGFGGYAASLGAEGLGRLALVASAWFAGPIPVTWYSAIFAFGTGCSALVGALCASKRRASRGSRFLDLDPRASVSGGEAVTCGGAAPRLATSGGLPSLAVATLLTYVIANMSGVIVTARLPDAALAAAFAAGLLLARVPLFAFSPVQVYLLTALSGAEACADRYHFRRVVLGGLAVALAFGALSLLCVLGFGAWILRELFSAQAPLSTVTLVCLLGSTVLLMGSQVLHAALVARGRHRAVAVSWTSGAVVLVAVLMSPGDPLAAAVVAQVIAAMTVVVVMAWVLSRNSAIRECAEVPAGDRNVHDGPLERRASVVPEPGTTLAARRRYRGHIT